MKSSFRVAILVVSLYVLSPICKAQDCSDWKNWDLRGTYATSGSGWMDLSKIVPTLPAGSVPVSWVGAGSYNGRGGGTGWVSLNAGGVHMNLEFVNMTYDVKPDCSVVISNSLKVKELGITVGPVSRVEVIAGKWPELELFGVMVGAGAGTAVESSFARRISMQFK